MLRELAEVVVAGLHGAWSSPRTEAAEEEWVRLC